MQLLWHHKSHLRCRASLRDNAEIVIVGLADPAMGNTAADAVKIFKAIEAAIGVDYAAYPSAP